MAARARLPARTPRGGDSCEEAARAGGRGRGRGRGGAWSGRGGAERGDTAPERPPPGAPPRGRAGGAGGAAEKPVRVWVSLSLPPAPPARHSRAGTRDAASAAAPALDLLLSRFPSPAFGFCSPPEPPAVGYPAQHRPAPPPLVWTPVGSPAAAPRWSRLPARADGEGELPRPPRAWPARAPFAAEAGAGWRALCAFLIGPERGRARGSRCAGIPPPPPATRPWHCAARGCRAGPGTLEGGVGSARSPWQRRGAFHGL